jgi:hypothetical protein
LNFPIHKNQAMDFRVPASFRAVAASAAFQGGRALLRSRGFSDWHRWFPWLRVDEKQSGFRFPASLISVTMFDIVKPQIATAADKLTHLRRFL